MDTPPPTPEQRIAALEQQVKTLLDHARPRPLDEQSRYGNLLLTFGQICSALNCGVMAVWACMLVVAPSSRPTVPTQIEMVGTYGPKPRDGDAPPREPHPPGPMYVTSSPYPFPFWLFVLVVLAFFSSAAMVVVFARCKRVA